MDRLTAGLRYINAGQAPIPIWPDERKNPHLSSYTEYCHRRPLAREWRRWVNRWPRCNIGLITGYWGLIGLDFDTQAAYDHWRGPKGQTWTVATRRGYHVWFRFSGNPGPSRMYVSGEHEVLLRAKGGYCIAPPSVHHTGARYRTVHWVEPLEIDSIDDYLPGWTRKKRESPKRSDLQIRQQSAPGPNVSITDLIPIPERARPNGRGAYQVRCPFHDDHRPSAWVNPQQGRFGCNSCWPGLWWDTINVYAMINNITNREAYRRLTNDE